LDITGLAGIIGKVISYRTTTDTNNEEVIEVLIDDNATEYEIEYETPASYATEETLSMGKQWRLLVWNNSL